MTINTQQNVINLLGQPRHVLERYFTERGESRYRATQILKWVHQHGCNEFDEMTNISKTLRARLANEASLSNPKIEREQRSKDGTVKWLMQIDSVNRIETVYIPEPTRATLCISSQVGCPLDCSFCATAQQGFNRNLASSEIIGQVWQANRALNTGNHEFERISNVVFMGMGEPLLNFEQVVYAIEILLDDCAYGLSRRRVTLSTAGLVPYIDKLAQRCPVALAVSLHAPDDALRDKLMPINRSYPLKDLLAACMRYVEYDPKQVITFEYALLAGVNDKIEHARALVRLLNGIPAKVNLIPFNPFQGSKFTRPDEKTITDFQTYLLNHGMRTMRRKTRGDDIDAACGQLIGKVIARSAKRRKLQADQMQSNC